MEQLPRCDILLNLKNLDIIASRDCYNPNLLSARADNPGREAADKSNYLNQEAADKSNYLNQETPV